MGPGERPPPRPSLPLTVLDVDPSGGPFASVVVTSHNSAPYIDAAISSLRAQTSGELEVIVVDDGSTDGTATLVRDKHPDITLLVQPNMGVAVARNHGIAASHGGWLAVLDADDLWAPTRLAELAGYISKVPECSAIATDVTGFAAEEDLPGLMVQGEEPEIVAPRTRVVEAALTRKRTVGAAGNSWTDATVLDREALLEFYPIRSPAFFVRRDVLQMAGLFQASSTGVSDFVLALNLTMIAPIHFLRHAPGESTALYRLEPRSLSHTNDMGMLLAAQLTAQHFGSLLSAGGPDVQLLRRSSLGYRRRYLNESVRYAVRQRDWRRWQVAVALGFALLPDAGDRFALTRLAIAEAVRTMPLLAHVRWPRGHRRGHGR